MSTHANPTPEFPAFEGVGKLLAESLHKARERQGPVVCPVCRLTFEAAHVLKCPGCRTFITDQFHVGQLAPLTETPPLTPVKPPKKTVKRKKSRSRPAGEEKIELDFFTQGYMTYQT